MDETSEGFEVDLFGVSVSIPLWRAIEFQSGSACFKVTVGGETETRRSWLRAYSPRDVV